MKHWKPGGIFASKTQQKMKTKQNILFSINYILWLSEENIVFSIFIIIY